MQEALLSKSWKEMELQLEECKNMIRQTNKDIMENLEEMKIVLVKERYMSKV